MSHTPIYIGDLNKRVLLEALWNNGKPASFFTLNAIPSPGFYPEWDGRERDFKHLDYVCGRAIKSDLSGDSVNPVDYDREYGSGAFAKVVTSLRV
jgi:hypothetical protein